MAVEARGQEVTALQVQLQQLQERAAAADASASSATRDAQVLRAEVQACKQQVGMHGQRRQAGQDEL